MAKKKTKPASNPARGFATTSIASKSKVDEKSDSADALESGSTTTAPTPLDSGDVNASEAPKEQLKELHELTPEEFEEQMERNELQLLIDNNAAKIRKEAARQITRIQTDRRVLRGQAQYLQTRVWLPEELMLQILDLAEREADDLDLSGSETSGLKPMSDEELVVRIWTLRQVLIDLGISLEQVENVIRKILRCQSSINTSGQIWGLQESLDLLALQCDEQELPPYDKPIANSGAISMNNSNLGTPMDTPIGTETHTPIRSSTPVNAPPVSQHESPSPPTPPEDGIEVSDLGSDMEPEELMSVYLSTKARLHALNPDMVTKSRSSARGSKKNYQNGGTVNASSAGALRLQRKVKQIESDVLFDKVEAEEKWNAQRNHLVQESAIRRRLQLPDEKLDTAKRGAKPVRRNVSDANDVLEQAAGAGNALSMEPNDSDDGDLLGGMFAALPDNIEDSQTLNGGGSDSSAQAAIRDFGKSVGMSPRRVLEEACRARDSGVKLHYKLVSPTTYASRHSLTIMWSKDQEISITSFLLTVSCEWSLRSTTITMRSITTPDSQQSEAYVSVAALFLLFSASPKEEKAYLRLPPNWRDLWMEFSEQKKEEIDAADRQVLKGLRTLIQEQRDQEAEQDVVLTQSFKKRNRGADGPSEPGRADKTTGDSQAEDREQLINMWKRKQSTPSYQRMLLSRMNLPMFHFREAALSTIERRQVTILCGETGCGKSTQLPAFILEHELSHGRPCKIYCTEPRRISAISLAQRVSQELGEAKNDVGTQRSLVGYAIRLESHIAPQTRLVYATVGIVLRMLELSRDLDNITHLIIDEVHERSIDTDFLLIVLRSLLIQRPELKVVLMSATVDAQRFSRYLDDAPIITVPGRTFPVQTKFLEDAIELTHYTGNVEDHYGGGDGDDESDEIDAGKSGIPKQLQGYSVSTRNVLASYDEYRIDYNLIVKLLEKVAYDPGHAQFSKTVLIFLPGIAEIRQLNDMLVGHPSFNQGWLIYPLHSTISSEEQQQAFEVPPPGMRKVVIATNIAETGITIPDVTCVIDTGKHKEMRYDERRQLSRLIQSFISRANAKQRRGRAGRVQEGLCFHLFTRYRHDELMAEQQTPEMLRLSLQDLVMRVKICKLGDIEQTLSQALDPPSAKNIRRAIDALIEVDALTPSEGLTPLGQQLAKLPLDAHLGKLVLLACVFGCVDIATTVAAILSSKSPFLAPLGAKQRADAARLTFKRGDSDLLTAYNAYAAWRRVCMTLGQSEFQFCRKNFLSPQNLAGVEDLKSQLLASMVDAGFISLNQDERILLSRYRYASRQRSFVPMPAVSNARNENDILTTSVIAWAFYPKVLTRDGKGWCNIANNQSVSLHPTSVNKSITTSNPQVRYLSYYHIMQSSGRAYNAHSTSVAHDLPLILLAGDADFRMHAGVIIVDGNRLRFAVKDWKTMIALKVLRRRLREIVNAVFRHPSRQWGDRTIRWMEVVGRVFEREEKRDGGGGFK